MCKIFETIITDKITCFWETHELIIHRQHGLRAGYSCTTQLLELTEDFTILYELKIPFDCIYLELAKDFVQMYHQILLTKLYNPLLNNRPQSDNNPLLTNNPQPDNTPQSDNNSPLNNHFQTYNNTLLNNNHQLNNKTQLDNNPWLNNNTQLAFMQLPDNNTLSHNNNLSGINSLLNNSLSRTTTPS